MSKSLEHITVSESMVLKIETPRKMHDHGLGGLSSAALRKILF